MWLTLIRHAQPAYVVDGVAWSDPPLTDLGQSQARRLADRISQWRLDELWVSPMVRAQETAAPVSEKLGVEPTTMDWLAEIQNPPSWDGSPAGEVEAFFAEERSVEDMWEGAPGGESFCQFHERIHGGLRDTLGERSMVESDTRGLWSGVDDRRVVVVAHGGTNALILGMLLAVEPTPWEWDRFTHVHSGVSRLITLPTAGFHSWSLRALSDRSHLADVDVTA